MRWWARSWFAVLAFGIWAVGSAAEVTEPRLSALASVPDWSLLNRYHGLLTRSEFLERMRTTFSPDGSLKDFLQLNETSVTVFRDRERTVALWTLQFREESGNSGRASTRGSLWVNPQSWDLPAPWLRGATPEQPLRGMVIALDPGHIGGEYGKIEERHFVYGNHLPVLEGELTVLVGRHLETALLEAGATVVWTKDNFQPVTPLRAADMRDAAEQLLLQGTGDRSLTQTQRERLLDQWSRLLFCRTAEIRERARRLNERLRPHLTLCIHFNAAPWRNARRPSLVRANRLVIFTHGAYTRRELEFDDQKFALFSKLLSNVTPHEVRWAAPVAARMRDALRLPPEDYRGWEAVHEVRGHPYLWARNLLANRLFEGPVVFIEGPYMNDRKAFYQIVAGDFEGERVINGKPQRSIFRVFAEAVAAGIVDAAKMDFGDYQAPDSSAWEEETNDLDESGHEDPEDEVHRHGMMTETTAHLGEEP